MVKVSPDVFEKAKAYQRAIEEERQLREACEEIAQASVRASETRRNAGADLARGLPLSLGLIITRGDRQAAAHIADLLASGVVVQTLATPEATNEVGDY